MATKSAVKPFRRLVEHQLGVDRVHGEEAARDDCRAADGGSHTQRYGRESEEPIGREFDEPEQAILAAAGGSWLAADRQAQLPESHPGSQASQVSMVLGHLTQVKHHTA